MKKTFALIAALLVAMVFAFAGCQKQEAPKPAETTAPTSTAASAPTSTATGTAQAAPAAPAAK